MWQSYGPLLFKISDIYTLLAGYLKNDLGYGQDIWYTAKGWIVDYLINFGAAPVIFWTVLWSYITFDYTLLYIGPLPASASPKFMQGLA